jgi:hypothetical protein
MSNFVQSNTTYFSGGNMFRLTNKSSYRMAWRWLVSKSKHVATWKVVLYCTKLDIILICCNTHKGIINVKKVSLLLCCADMRDNSQLSRKDPVLREEVRLQSNSLLCTISISVPGMCDVMSGAAHTSLTTQPLFCPCVLCTARIT